NGFFAHPGAPTDLLPGEIYFPTPMHLDPPDTPIQGEGEGVDDDHDEDDADVTDEDEIVTLDRHDEAMDEDVAGPSNAVAGPSASAVVAVTEAAAAARPKQKMKEFNELPQELLIEVLLNLEPIHLAVASRTNKRMWTITKDLSFRATYFSHSLDRTEVIHAALQ
ncbi:hypothetical protein CF335_g9759, partial [Tilletia laevis]